MLLDTTIFVHYRFLTLHSEATGPSDGDDARTQGQVNELCGAAVPGELSLVTGTHTGMVRLAVELTGDEPPVGEEWEEVVVVPFSSAADDLAISAFQDSTGPLNLPPGNYHARYCARGMAEDGADERYLLQFWPVRDRIVRRTGEWHHRAAASPATVEERVAAVQAGRERRLAAEERVDSWDEEAWMDAATVVDVDDDPVAMPDSQDYLEGRSPVDRLAARDPGLVVALIGVDEGTRRAVARWAAEDALAAAGVAGERWVREMLDGSGHETWSVSIVVEDDDPTAGLALRTAFDAVAQANRPDALTAACGALWREDPGDDVLLRVRREFPDF